MAQDGGLVHVELNAASLRKIMQMARDAGPVMKKEVYKSLRAAAQPAAEEAADTIRSAPVHGRVHTGLRQKIAAGVSVNLGRGNATMGIRIVSSGRKLPEGSQRMNRTYNAVAFQHPIFGHPPMVTQRGLRWFEPPIEAHKAQYQAAVLKAMEETARKLTT